METPDEGILTDVRAAMAGNGDAYARIIRRYQPAFARRMVRFTRDRAAVEELVHDVFVEAYYSLEKYRGDAPFEHWLQRIATRVGYRYWKRRRDRTVPLSEETISVAVSDNSRNAAADAVAVLEQLPPRDRLVLTLLYLESRSVAEAADLAGWSQTMIKVQAYRARHKLRKLLTESRDSEK